MTSLPVIVHRAAQKDLKPSMGRVSRFTDLMVLFHHIIEIFRVAEDNRSPVRLVVVLNRCRVAPTLVNRDLLRDSMSANRFV